MSRLDRKRAVLNGRHSPARSSGSVRGGGSGSLSPAQRLLQLQRSAGNQATVALLQRDYADVPTKAQWLTDSHADRKKRTAQLVGVDDAVDEWDKVKGGDDKPAKISALRGIRDSIRSWELVKRQKYASETKSRRSTQVADLKQVVEVKIKEVLDAHAVDLQPLADEYLKAAKDHDIAEALDKGTKLGAAHGDFFLETLQAGLKTAKGRDKLEWGTLFFCAPPGSVGTPAINAMQLRALGDYSWIDRAMADRIITDFIVPNSARGGQGMHIMQMLEIMPFRQALQASATPKTWKDLNDSMPLLRITAAAEKTIADNGIAADQINQLAEAVFWAFIGDLPKSKLIYSTNAVNFKLDDFVLGSSDPAVGAPCMALSSVFRELFKMVTSNPPPIEEGEDRRPMLTKPLKAIGTTGILTRDGQFSGNVAVYGNTRGYDTINRVFFGDGHVWLKINGREYDPTLGITGPAGTVAKQVETIFAPNGKDKYKAGKLRVKRTNAVPPGGQRLLFTRSAEITGL